MYVCMLCMYVCLGPPEHTPPHKSEKNELKKSNTERFSWGNVTQPFWDALVCLSVYVWKPYVCHVYVCMYVCSCMYVWSTHSMYVTNAMLWSVLCLSVYVWKPSAKHVMYVCYACMYVWGLQNIPPLTILKKLNWWSNTERFSWGNSTQPWSTRS